MNMEFSTFTKWFGNDKGSLEVTRHIWPWWEWRLETLFYFHPWLFFRFKIEFGPIGIGFTIKIGDSV